MPDHPVIPPPEPHVVSEDRVFSGALRLLQPRKGNRAGTDGVLLAASLPPEARRIADLGAGTGIVGLRAAQMNGEARIHLFENEPATAALCRRNIALNGLEARAVLEERDVLMLGRDTQWREVFDHVLTNPPYYDPAASRPPRDEARARAFQVEGGTLSQALDQWARNATAILAPKGMLTMIHRADAIEAILAALSPRIGGLRLVFVHPRADQPAHRVLVCGIKGSRAPLAVLPPIVLHEADGGFTPEAEGWHAGHMRLKLGPSSS